MDADAIVVGSGFGGAVTAARLADAGYRVIVLERGRRWGVKDFPRKPEDPWIFDQEQPLERNGWFDVRVFPHMVVVAGAGVGGGSLVYANISVNAKDDSFDEGMASRDHPVGAGAVLRARRRHARRAEGAGRSVARAHAAPEGRRRSQRMEQPLPAARSGRQLRSRVELRSA